MNTVKYSEKWVGWLGEQNNAQNSQISVKTN